MSESAWLKMAVYCALVTALAVPLGRAIGAVYGGEARTAPRPFGALERTLYRAAGVRPDEEMSWSRYATSLLAFNAAGMLFLYVLQRLQGMLPLNGAGRPAVEPHVALNTAVSFATNTDWQAYAGETTMSALTQALGLGVQNFLSAATGLAVLVALVRGFTRNRSASIGSFWVDLVRGTLYVLLPLSIALAVVLVSQGVPQTLADEATASLLEPRVVADGASRREQSIPLGLVASQVAIKQLGTNGGGFYNANSAHPLENPTPLTNALECVAILLVPAASCFAVGWLLGDRRQGRALFASMGAIFVPLMIAVVLAEQAGNPALTALGVDRVASDLQAGGNMEGKEVRFGVVDSAIWAVATTAASNGSVNAMHDSFTPLGGLVPLWLIELGEVVYGGVGSGLYGLFAFAIVAVFIGGLMIGRTPEYLGKKIEGFEMKMASLVILIPSALVLIGTAAASVLPAGTAPVGNPGPHGFSEILYAFSSASGNNGSAFGGLTASGSFYAWMLAVAMFVGRYGLIIPVLAIAGSLAAKPHVPPSAGTLPTHGPLFVAFLVSTVLLVGALTFLPALALGPVVEHLKLGGS